MEKELETRSTTREHRLYRMDNGDLIKIGGNDLDFFDQLRSLPARQRIELMNLTEADILNYITEKKKEKASHILSLIVKRWLWRDTGESANIQDIIEDRPLSRLKTINRSYKSFSLDELQEIIDRFTGDNADVYEEPQKELI